MQSKSFYSNDSRGRTVWNDARGGLAEAPIDREALFAIDLDRRLRPSWGDHMTSTKKISITVIKPLL